ncbi:MAG: hypothetical protein A2622_00090 [Bdellovibrionales bacterium RIFCSPHIGHO2_01_FULL_40_29]|nr:MAG: hypothetical protein A2622_00090 [Bdellovibrionales bacterium RIFCSPHIGHO2_01_FULL_40_29]OFZ32527.1 MAG: hypothetical protein A3D17_04690 [Bdellovibrionales bacterium RIFCSPHIGHO2_02_FULL_40_15]
MISPAANKPSLIGQRLSTFLTAVLLFCFLAPFAQAAPKISDNYDVIQGGLTNIKDGAFVEGSLKMGGIQPDYFIDLTQEPLKSVMKSAEKIGHSKKLFWDKVGLIVELVRSDVFKYNNYHNPYYRRLLKKYRETNADIPLHEYGVCAAGVCREHALVLHFALKAAGIENLHGYASIYRASKWLNFEVYEDHAFTVVEHKGTKWVVDAYYWGFNGFRLIDLMSPYGITEATPHAPIADPAPGTRRILQINNFPIIYNPKNISSKCSAIF